MIQNDESVARPLTARDRLPNETDHGQLSAASYDLTGLINALDRNTRAVEALAQPKPPVGLFAVVLARFNEGNPPILYAHGRVIAYYDTTNTIWLRDYLGDTFDVRLHQHDDEDSDADSVWVGGYYASETAFVAALVARHKHESSRSKAKATYAATAARHLDPQVTS